MSFDYDRYLIQHKDNVIKGFKWLQENLPDLFLSDDGHDMEYLTCYMHDKSKDSPDEYRAYDEYFYGNNKSWQVVQDFNKAWLLHIHRNPHHWQYWVLINDDPNEGEIIIDMPRHYIIEMICDWWSFSWQKGDLTEIFKWYEDRKEYIKLSDKTRKTVEHILKLIASKIEEPKGK